MNNTVDDKLIRSAVIQFTEKCNLRCSYCMADSFDGSYRSRELSLDNFNVFMAFARQNNINLVKITGGEPSLHRRFASFVNIRN